MYKFVLCWRYLRTRYIALISIVSVTLGVATLIVVNSVMSGFTHEMEDRAHSILSDIVFEGHGLEGFSDAEWHMAKIREIVGDDIAAMTPTVHVPAMLNYQVGGRYIHRQVNVIGIDPETYGSVTSCSEYLQHPKNREKINFVLREDGYDVRDHTLGPDNDKVRHGMETAGWVNRRHAAEREAAWLRLEQQHRSPQQTTPGGRDPFAGIETPMHAAVSDDGVDQEWQPLNGNPRIFDKAVEQETGIVIGFALARVPDAQGNDLFLTLPGDDVKLTFPTAGAPPKAVSGSFTIVDFYESKMSEYDSAFVFVPIRKLQEMRGMINPSTGVANATGIQIRLREGVNLNEVRDKLRAAFPPELYSISTWRDKQGPLAEAIEMERAVLNLLLFMIIAVAGFGILAIFYMIVVEKTKDIGVLKSLGASGNGIMSIFVSYGVALGAVGSGAGLITGLLFVHYIDNIRRVLERLSGQKVFDPSIYYFQEIPTIVEPVTVTWIIGGAILIAVAASVLPAMRAARLHPVEALRYE